MYKKSIAVEEADVAYTAVLLCGYLRKLVVAV